MTTNFKKMTCRALVVSLLALSFSTAKAGMIGADQAATQAAQSDRAVVMNVLNRSETVAQLQANGVDPQTARDRVNAMTDQEVHALAQDIQTAPAGGMSGWGWAAVVIVVALVWSYAYRR